MSSTSLTTGRSWRPSLPRRHVPVLATLALLLVMYGIGVSQYRAFSNVQVVFNVFIDNGFLLVVAVGMTFVILTGGIDLSVGSVVAMTAMVSAALLRDGLPAALVLVIALLIGPTLGFLMGCAIHFFEIQPFIVTLAGMFFARGMCTFISDASISITDGFWTSMSQQRIGDPAGNFVSISVLIAFAVVLIAAYVLAYTRFGRNVYAVGGNAQSALLMGLPVARTRIAVYTISGLCSAIGGILLSFYTLSGAPLIAVGMELDVIAAVVIGGTVLTGGSGYVFGTVLGVLVLGVIQTLITFDGSLNSWWTKIVIGGLLFAFILLQRLIGIRFK
ncbi:galactofuranose ABC transporter, permease protein YjfF [Micromonospora aurantiaca]|uniref:Sugar ABC transporter permease YjfF n=2 Tax=Micromonospora TaxID=1873 RepID=A0A1C6S1H0_9ACTN|nr:MULTISPECIES: galactofuranose ABC transporter, permease protein YjfF [Micromonospora]ADL47200.1 inner-membrane translocator [Micromonospora aurantiaca ATCC 27029]ADU10200.1 inner-membrane translocator [Micromonospora sp. L5]AXH93119.1 sugar ABC transporter permease YjfF [Micromonospora aurantiaca]MBC9000792.1 sugar ABC transporter permease YjfF [Micromonospora aurantiaca]MBU8861374.1 sugar ABC transporter permease YjfF [Micromonospora sp. WMMB482]